MCAEEEELHHHPNAQVYHREGQLYWQEREAREKEDFEEEIRVRRGKAGQPYAPPDREGRRPEFQYEGETDRGEEETGGEEPAIGPHSRVARHWVTAIEARNEKEQPGDLVRKLKKAKDLSKMICSQLRDQIAAIPKDDPERERKVYRLKANKSIEYRKAQDRSKGLSEVVINLRHRRRLR